HQPLNQRSVTMGTDCPAQPQARADHQRHRQPQHTSLSFEADFIRLHLLQLARLDKKPVMHALTVCSGSLHPFANGLGLEAEGAFDRRNGTAIADQRDDARDGVLVGAPAKEERTGTLAERFATYSTAIARWRAAMNPNGALTNLASCRTVQVRAE